MLDLSSPVSFVKTLLRMMSDYTFLSSLDNIDFRQNIVTVKTGYWRSLAYFIRKNWDTEQKLGSILRIIKLQFLDRLADVSATKLKQFFLGKIRNSFFDFKNMLYYGYSYMKDGNPFKKDIRKLRQVRYYEKKAKVHYERYINSVKYGSYLANADLGQFSSQLDEDEIRNIVGDSFNDIFAKDEDTTELEIFEPLEREQSDIFLSTPTESDGDHSSDNDIDTNFQNNYENYNMLPDPTSTPRRYVRYEPDQEIIAPDPDYTGLNHVPVSTIVDYQPVTLSRINEDDEIELADGLVYHTASYNMFGEIVDNSETTEQISEFL